MNEGDDDDLWIAEIEARKFVAETNARILATASGVYQVKAEYTDHTGKTTEAEVIDMRVDQFELKFPGVDPIWMKYDQTGLRVSYVF